MKASLEQSRYDIYRSVIAKVLNGQESLPSLPTITLKIRQAINDPNTTHTKLSMLVGSDPSLSALLMKSASSPMYRTASAPKTLESVISILGYAAVNNIVMVHSINSLFVFRSPVIKKLFNISRNRQVVKGAMSGLLAHKLAYRPADEALMVSLLSEVGTLALLSAFKDTAEVPDTETYFKLCRDYSKSLGVILLTKWNIDQNLISIIKNCGRWEQSTEGELSLLDIINLALYHTIKRTNPQANLPPLQTIAAYKKLQSAHNSIHPSDQLNLVVNNEPAIKGMIQLLQ